MLTDWPNQAYICNCQTHWWACTTHTQHHQHTRAFWGKCLAKYLAKWERALHTAILVLHTLLSPLIFDAESLRFCRGFFNFRLLLFFLRDNVGRWSTWTSLRNQIQKHTVIDLKAFAVTSVKMLTCNERKLTQAVLISAGWLYRLFAWWRVQQCAKMVLDTGKAPPRQKNNVIHL